MSVEVSGLTKRFGQQAAVDALSFSVEKGILGFLGPNGAGKSTTMRVLTGFLQPDEGEVRVCGHRVDEEPLRTKRCIGYLPEHNPLYPDLYIREYLSIMCAVQNVRDARKRIPEVVAMTGLEHEIGKKIGALSKGFRQRVGLAQALLHDPRVLILDEPTSGLDPNQLAEIRKLIASLGAEKTIIFSTHIMQEVQAICDRVLIINNGRMVLDEPISYLEQRSGGQARIHVQFDRRILSNTLRALPGVVEVEEKDGAVYVVTTEEGKDLRAELFRYAVDKGAVILEMYQLRSTVEDVFQDLTRQQ